MVNLFDTLRERLSAHAIHDASEEAARLAESVPDACKQSSEYLTLAGRLCALNRQWGYCQLLTLRALETNSFENTESRHWASALFAFTAGCDLILRVYPEAHPRHRGKILDQIPVVISWFDDAVSLDANALRQGGRELGKEFKLDWLQLLTRHREFPPKIQRLLRDELKQLEQVFKSPSGGSLVDARRKSVESASQADWVLQVDANEIGNEARYANHADYPNAVLVKRCASRCNPCKPGTGCEHFMPHIVALRTIAPGDEITINYGSSYWKKVRPGTDPVLLGQVISAPFTDCIYYDGVVDDFGCSPAPGGFLIPPNATERRRRRSDSLAVNRVPRNHPAFPGFGLYATKPFGTGDILCIYAGIVDKSPHNGRHASKYTVDLTGDPAIGPFGFSLYPSTLDIIEKQRYLPYLTPFRDISIPRRDGENLLCHVENISEVGEPVTRTICRALAIPEFRLTVREKLAEIKEPFDNPSKIDTKVWSRSVRKTFADLLTKPPVRRSLDAWVDEKRNEPELTIVLDDVIMIS